MTFFHTVQASLDAFTSKLSEKTAELNTLRTENENMKVINNKCTIIYISAICSLSGLDK